MKVLTSKKSDHWSTPAKLYNWYIERGYIDPCPLHCKIDALTKKDWPIRAKYFVNPPYSNINSFVELAIQLIEVYEAIRIILLVPARTDTKWFHKIINSKYCDSLEFIRGRLKFGNSNNSAPFPTILITMSYSRYGHIPYIVSTDGKKYNDK